MLMIYVQFGNVSTICSGGFDDTDRYTGAASVAVFLSGARGAAECAETAPIGVTSGHIPLTCLSFPHLKQPCNSGHRLIIWPFCSQ